MEMDSDIIIEIRELSDKMETLRRFMLDAPYMKDIEEKMDLELRLKKAVMENDALLFRVEAMDNRIAKLVAENAELTKMRNYLYDTLEGSDDPDVG